jgi:hypothetical protein
MNPARPWHSPRRLGLRPSAGREAAARKHCAAQAEYARLAAQAYSPSDAMSQAKIGLDGVQKVQRLDANFVKQGSGAETASCGRRICCEGGVFLQIFPVVGDLAALPHAAGSFQPRKRSSGLAAGIPLRTRWIRLSRRGVGSGWPVRPDRLGRSCRFRLPIERREPSGEMGAGPLQHLQDRFVGDGLLHIASHSVAILTAGSGEAASTLKIVGGCLTDG